MDEAMKVAAPDASKEKIVQDLNLFSSVGLCLFIINDHTCEYRNTKFN